MTKKYLVVYNKGNKLKDIECDTVYQANNKMSKLLGVADSVKIVPILVESK